MRLPPVRFKLWVVFVAIAAVAVVIALLMRPHPVASMSSFVKWSDGSRTMNGPSPTRYHPFGPLLTVDWSDGTSSWYLSRTQIRHALLGDSPANWIATLTNDPNDEARDQAASEITENADDIDPGLVVPALIASMKDDSPRVRFSVAFARWRFAMRSTAALPSLAEATKDEEVRVRITAVEALGDVPKTDESKKIAIPALVGALKDARNIVRCRAARKLVAWAEGGAGVPAMIEILQGRGAPETREDDRTSNRRYALESLEVIGAPARAAIPVLISATQDDDAEVRVGAAKALVVVGEQEVALPVLERVFADRSQRDSVRELARRELAKLRAKRDNDLSPQSTE